MPDTPLTPQEITEALEAENARLRLGVAFHEAVERLAALDKGGTMARSKALLHLFGLLVNQLTANDRLEGAGWIPLGEDRNGIPHWTTIKRGSQGALPEQEALAALDKPQFVPPNKRIAPPGWKSIAVRTPEFDEHFIGDDGQQIGYQDGKVSFKGRNSVHLIIAKEAPDAEQEPKVAPGREFYRNGEYRKRLFTYENRAGAGRVRYATVDGKRRIVPLDLWLEWVASAIPAERLVNLASIGLEEKMRSDDLYSIDEAFSGENDAE